jgi:maltooligosyltrehalose trehalohydrolase
MLELYRALIAVRKERPELTDPRFGRTSVEVDDAARTLLIHRGPKPGDLTIAVNLGETVATFDVPGRVLLSTDGTTDRTAGPLELGPRSAAILAR